MKRNTLSIIFILSCLCFIASGSVSSEKVDSHPSDDNQVAERLLILNMTYNSFVDNSVSFNKSERLLIKLPYSIYPYKIIMESLKNSTGYYNKYDLFLYRNELLDKRYFNMSRSYIKMTHCDYLLISSNNTELSNLRIKVYQHKHDNVSSLISNALYCNNNAKDLINNMYENISLILFLMVVIEYISITFYFCFNKSNDRDDRDDNDNLHED